MKLNIILEASLAVLFAACSSLSNDENISVNEDYEAKSSASVIVEQFENDDEAIIDCINPIKLKSKKKVKILTSPISVRFDGNERLGVFCVTEGTNNSLGYFTLSTDDGTSATFDGNGWLLNTEKYSYGAYYPCDNSVPANTSYKSIPIDMTGQIQSGNNNTEHLGPYDWMFCEKGTPINGGNVQFVMKQAVALVRLHLKMPEGSWNNVSLTSDNSVFTTQGTFNLLTGNVSPSQTSNSVSIGITNLTTTKGEEIDIWALILPTTTGPLTIKVSDSDKEYKSTIDSKTLTAGKYYTMNANFIPEDNGHEYVDLGLSVKWATCNVGANEPEGYGSYYAWGVTGLVKQDSWKYYFDTSDNGKTFNKYKRNGKTVLDPEDDAAHVNWGGEWRMPSDSEFEELRKNCTTSFETRKGVNGYLVKSANGNSIFIPLAGFYDNSWDRITNRNFDGHYWTRNLYVASTDERARTFGIYTNSAGTYTRQGERYQRYSVRPVHP